ncbi:Fanconi anemia group A protein isoform X2 [Hippoglossus hippoglossus]|uniref:Fanconi anemia group A protein isoform X2 n=1 Tax=Hippoglossus hippoglossus TaxID=8267 RepID=UPI00148D60CB|nr:Fanconi anemia group A protein isoform X2 [Hippoglossus hippoglossus]XP_034445147.1 Fanconi anemia group A protein isoform X2 [Hippoglossus hippoglossus]
MSVNPSCEEQGVSRLLAGRVVNRPQLDDAPRLQEAAVQLLQQQQDLCSLLREVSNPDRCCQTGEQSRAAPGGLRGSLLECELRRQATELGVPVAVLSVKLILERLTEITAPEGEEDERRELLTSSQRVQLCVLLESSRELMSQGALCPKLLWQEYRRDQRLPKLEVLNQLHCFSFLSLKYILESDDGVRVWLVSRLKALCSWTPPRGEEETKRVQLRVLSTVVGVLVGCGFELNSEPAAPDQRRISLLCCSLLDEMLFWLLDTVDKSLTSQSSGAGPGLWIQIFDASLCGVSASAEAVQRFFTHSLTQALTYKPRLTVSDAVTLQSDWTFAKADPLLMSLFRKLAVIFSVELLLRHLQQVLETHEVNWKHVLCFLSTLLVYNPCAPPSLRELLSRLLTSAFEGYDLEHMITAFLLARQGALEGAGVFSSYSDWFKMSFGGSSGFHASSKKSLVFLLKFLSDLVPFEPPQYLKVHILHPPFIPVKHRSLLMEYISLAKTRLADLKESVEDMGLYEDISGAGGASGSTQPQCQAVQDVEKAVSLFESTGRISATVMEASIFRRPYFLTRFLPALLKPRVLPVKADARMSLIEALKKAEKLPAAQHSSYVESCQRQRRQDRSVVCLDAADDPLEVLKVQLQEFRGLVVDGNDGDMMAQLSRISHTLCVVFPGRPDELMEQTVIKVHVDAPLSPELHVKVINMILRNFCQCTLDTSRANPPNKQNLWASRFVSVLPGNTQLICSLVHRLWDLFHNQGSSLSAAHVLGLAAFVVHLHGSVSHSSLIQLVPPILPKPVPVGEAVSAALVCSTHTDMLFCVRFCVAAVCYGICRGHSLPQQQQDYVPSSFYKKLLYLIPRLLPEARRTAVTAEGAVGESPEKNLWSSATDAGATWRTTAWRLWRHAAFHQLQNTPQYQLSFSDWLVNELRVQRSEDALSDPERQEYQQWACLELFLPRAEEQGGCGGDMRILCSRLLDAVMDQQLKDQSLEKLHQRASATGTCLPDIISRLQEFVYEMEVTGLSGSRSGRADVCDFLFEFISRRCSSTVSSVSPSVSSELSLQHTLNTWNRVLLALPPLLLVKLKVEGGRTTLDCTTLMQHVNQHQRNVCSPAGLMSSHLTSHLLRGVLSASVSCGRPREEVNKAWTQISVHCPLLLTSAVRWWERLSPVLSSLWSRVCDGEPLPEQLQLLADCGHWAHSVARCLSPPPPMPPAPALLLASSLHRAWRGRGGGNQSFGAALNMLRPERVSQDRQVLVFLLFLCVNDHLLTLLCLQEKSDEESLSLCSDLLCVLVDSSDWLLIFKSSEQGVYQSVTMVTSDEFTRLMPWAFYSLLLQQSAELLQRALRCPGFLQAAVLCYTSLLQLVLDGHAPASAAEPPEKQLDPSQILSQAKMFLLRVISQTSAAALSSAQLRRLESQCADVDPEVAAALSVHLGAPSLSPEMDFL